MYIIYIYQYLIWYILENTLLLFTKTINWPNYKYLDWHPTKKATHKNSNYQMLQQILMYNNDYLNDNVRYMNFKYYIKNKTIGLI
jgi:hypothetical protein